MLPDNFDFAQLPEGVSETTLKEIGMLSSTIETIDMAFVSWLKNDLNLRAKTNSGFETVPVYWQTPERSFQVKDEKSLRDERGSIILPVISVERKNIVKDPAKKGGFQAHLFSDDKNGRAGRITIAKKIKQDKTRNFAVASGTRTGGANKGTRQQFYPRVNKKIVVQTLTIPIPIYVDVQYQITIKTEYQQQMNQLMQPFMTRTGQINSFVLKRNGHLYEAFIDTSFTHNNNVSDLAEDRRMFETTININILGYLIGEGDNDDRPIVRVEENAVEVTFPREQAMFPGDPGFFMD